MNLAKGITRAQTQYFIIGLATSSFLIMMGCSNPFELEENKVSFDGYYFSSKLSRSKLDDRSFDLQLGVQIDLSQGLVRLGDMKRHVFVLKILELRISNGFWPPMIRVLA